MRYLLTAICLLVAGVQSQAQQTNSLGMQMVKIEPGTFKMGSNRGGEDFDEAPVHTVTLSKAFWLAATEVTNKQYEAFDPSHKQYRGKNGFSQGDDEAVVFVSYNDAVAFCKWLSAKEGRWYRLPYEDEWEFACRAGTTTDYNTGNELPAIYQKQQKNNRTPVPVSLQVAQTPANAWGLYDMHGNVEEWCSSWYGPYVPQASNRPFEYVDGLYRVTRGGSHNTFVRYLRSANRQAMLPDDKHWLTGFRVMLPPPVLPSPPRATTNKSMLVEPPAFNSRAVSQQTWSWTKSTQPFFAVPEPYVIKPDSLSGTPFYKHNHCPAITWLPNGDLLAAWFSTDAESGREMVILASRLRAGKKSWDTASEFFRVPDRNLTGTSLLYDGKGTLYHINGVEAAGDWQNLAMVMRTSKNNGASWSKPSIIAPEHAKRHQVIAGLFKTKENWLVQLCDADPSSSGGTAVHMSKDGGKHWAPLDTSAATPVYKAGNTGGLIAGIHASMVQLKDGSFMALGRNDNIRLSDSTERMTMSVSHDGGKMFTYSASPFPPIASGQRLVFRRLNEGALLVISFTHCPGKSKEEGMLFNDANGKSYRGYGMYAAVSFDEGKTWPIVKLLTDGTTRLLNGGAWTGNFTMDATHAEPRGYLAATQTPDNVIHLVSSNLHYQFNLAWLVGK